MRKFYFDRRSFMQYMIYVACALMLLQPGCSSKKDNRLNVLLIVSEDMGPHLGCYGDATVPTPNLDTLAKEGICFKNAFVTQASCSPSRSSILTGLFPHQNGQTGLAGSGYSMHPGIQTLPTLLRNIGYKTGLVGKLHVSPDDAFSFNYRSTLKHTNSRNIHMVADKAEHFFKETHGKPFFLMVNYFDAHRPFMNSFDGYPEKPVSYNKIHPLNFLGLDTEDLRKETAGYYNGISRVDTGVGQLLEKLNQYRYKDNTLVIFIGDHGPAFDRAKCSCYEAGLHVPLIIRWPGNSLPGKVSEALISTVDIVPTVLDAVGANLSMPVAGKSLLPLLQNHVSPWRKYLFAEYTSHYSDRHYFPRRSIRDNRYKLILNLQHNRRNPVLGTDGCSAWKASRNPDLKKTFIRQVYDRYKRPPEIELYDLLEDPCEFENIANKPHVQKIRKRLLENVQQWRINTGDPLL